MRTIDPYLTDNGLPEYPNLPATTESYKVNEIRRTVVFDNIDAKVSFFFFMSDFNELNFSWLFLSLLLVQLNERTGTKFTVFANYW